MSVIASISGVDMVLIVAEPSYLFKRHETDYYDSAEI
jgi:MinD superfamily P-loop ATPase